MYLRTFWGFGRQSGAGKITDFVARRGQKLLKKTKIGLIGYSSMNIYPGTFDHLFLRTKIGPEVRQMDAYTVIGRVQDYGREALLDGAAKIGKQEKFAPA